MSAVMYIMGILTGLTLGNSLGARGYHLMSLFLPFRCEACNKCIWPWQRFRAFPTYSHIGTHWTCDHPRHHYGSEEDFRADLELFIRRLPPPSLH